MKYFIYARKSTDEDDRQVRSIEAQITELKEFAAKEGLLVADEFIESKTAKVPGRPVFNRMIEKIEAGEPTGILAWHPDRLARNSVDGGKIIYLVDIGKIAGLKFPTFWFEATPQGKFMLNIAFGQSKYYVDNLSENIKRGIRQKLRNGEKPGIAPHGYINDLRTHKVVKDPERWQAVAQLFEAYATGDCTLENLQKMSLSFGLVSRHTGKTIVLSRLQKMLQNPFFYGVFVHKGEMYQGCHEPIISKQLYDQVQKVLKQRGKPQKASAAHNFTFLGMFKCGECGRAITAEKKVKPSSKTYIYYRCTKKNRVCHQKFVEEKILVKQLDDVFTKVALSDDWRDLFLRQLEKDSKEILTNSNSAAEALRTELNKLESKLKRLLDTYLEQTITKEEYTAVKQKIINRKVEIQEKLSSKGNNWLGLFRNWILEAHQANSVGISGNLEEKRSFLQKIGSDFQITAQKAAIQVQKPWVYLAHKNESTVWSG